MINLRILSPIEVDSAIIRWIRSELSDRSCLEILEAGCGRQWPLKLSGLRYRLTGIDQDEAALNHRRDVIHDLDVCILGDLHDLKLDEDSFDLIYCSYVLEHVRDASRVISNFSKWLKIGGVLVVKIPDPQSVHGFFASHTPHWFHILYYKLILRQKTAGQPGYPPYPTRYSTSITREGFKSDCAANSLGVLEIVGFGQYPQTIKWFATAVNFFTFGRLAASHASQAFICKKENG